jgi:hypothetical protein
MAHTGIRYRIQGSGEYVGMWHRILSNVILQDLMRPLLGMFPPRTAGLLEFASTLLFASQIGMDPNPLLGLVVRWW